MKPFTVNRLPNGRVQFELSYQTARALSSVLMNANSIEWNPRPNRTLVALQTAIDQQSSDSVDESVAVVNQLVDEAYGMAVEKLRIDDSTTIESLLLHSVSEIAEAYEETRMFGAAPDYETILYDDGGHGVSLLHRFQSNPMWKPVGFAAELADGIITLLEIAGRFRIDLGNALRIKMAHNRLRPAQPKGTKVRKYDVVE